MLRHARSGADPRVLSGTVCPIDEIDQLTRHLQTPFLFLSLPQVRDNYRRIQTAADDIEIFYAVKANDDSAVLRTVMEAGGGFEISSLSELESIRALGVPGSRLLCLNPIKNTQFLHALHSHGIRALAADSFTEIDKLASNAPEAPVLTRVAVSNEGSEWPLSEKFGATPAQSLELLLYAKSKGLQPAGLTFHVGSQCLRPATWTAAINTCAQVWKQAELAGLRLDFLSLGGGIPTSYGSKPVPTTEQVMGEIHNTLRLAELSSGNGITVTMEPGRGIVGDAGTLVTTVLGTAERTHGRWLYIDVGVFNGLMETIEDFRYDLRTLKDGQCSLATVGGPSCDSVDVPFRNVLLPDALARGDRIFIPSAGAYTTVYASSFNGFGAPNRFFLDE